MPLRKKTKSKLLQAQTLSVSMELPVFQPGSAFSNLVSLSFHLQPTQSLRARPQNIDGSTVLRLLALWPSTVVRAPVSTMACIQPQPAPIIPRPSPSPLAPPLLASTVPKGPVLTPSGQSMTSERNREASAPGSLGTCCGMPARFPLTPQVLAIPGPPTKGALHSTSFPTSSPVKEPRGDV